MSKQQHFGVSLKKCTFSHCVVVDYTVRIIHIRSLGQRRFVLLQRLADHDGVLFGQKAALPFAVLGRFHFQFVPSFQFRSKCL